jgi:hypothetical protein
VVKRKFSLCVEVRFRPAQPTSRGLSGSLATLAKSSKRSPELRDQLAVLHSDVTTERAFQRKKAASLPVYLYWAFSGVTLAEVPMVDTIGLAFESDALSHLVAAFRA